MTKPVYILGIHDGHNCGATLTRDDVVVASVSEERLTRRKNEVGYPRLSIEEVLKIGGVGPSELDHIVYASLFMHAKDYLTKLEDWYCVGLADQRKVQRQPKDYQAIVFDQRRRERIDTACDQLGCSEDLISFVEHHRAHLAAAYYCAPNVIPGTQVLGLTCDGAGDNLCATVSICEGNSLKRIAKTDRHASLGKIYSRATMLMGMNPWEHEYKLMGMAPYADPERTERAMVPLRALLKLSADGLSFEQATELSMNYCYEYLRDSMERVRFDVVAAAVQKLTEEMLVEWVRSVIAKTGINTLVCGGGVFMNVKANMLIAELPEVKSMFVMPSGGDESLSIGACLHHYHEVTNAPSRVGGALDNLYLGGGYSAEDEERALATELEGMNVKITAPSDIDAEVAALLAQGQVVARCRGRMEWGARSLGNRSILAPADDFRIVDRINSMIKMRDFWMPFAPSIIEERAGDYFSDPKAINPEFMTFAFTAKDDHLKDLVAGAHPRDRTIRPQLVRKAANPGYHHLISSYEKLTGRGAVLNTSFNLHGEPIVQGPADALRVLRLSGLNHLALDGHIISKRSVD